MEVDTKEAEEEEEEEDGEAPVGVAEEVDVDDTLLFSKVCNLFLLSHLSLPFDVLSLK